MTLEDIKFCAQILGSLFLTDPKTPEFQPLRERLQQLPSLVEWPFGGKETLAADYALLQTGLAGTSANRAQADRELAREYQRLFIGPQHFNAPAWGSVYLDKDQVLFGTSLLELRHWLRKNSITVHAQKREPEDHIGKMLVLLGWLAAEKPELLREFLAEHLMPWAPRYLQLLQEDAAQPFYAGLALLTQATLDGIVASLGVEVVTKRLYF